MASSGYTSCSTQGRSPLSKGLSGPRYQQCLRLRTPGSKIRLSTPGEVCPILRAGLICYCAHPLGSAGTSTPEIPALIPRAEDSQPSAPGPCPPTSQHSDPWRLFSACVCFHRWKGDSERDGDHSLFAYPPSLSRSPYPSCPRVIFNYIPFSSHRCPGLGNQ